jgi:hypothetical protein
MLRVLAVLHVLAGASGIVFSVGISAFAAGFGNGWSIDGFFEVLAFFGPLGLAGLLYCLAGVALWRAFPAVKGKVLIHQSATWLLCLAQCVVLCIETGGRFGVGGRDAGPPYDEELVMYLLVPAAALLVVGIESCYLWKKWKAGKRAPVQKGA